MYSGTASNIVGTAKRISKSNGALIFGTGNEITNSYITPDSPIIMDSLSTNVPFIGTLSLTPTVSSSSIKELADTLRKYSNDNRMGSVGIMGGANKVDYALFSTVSGVGNTLTGRGASNSTVLNSGNTKLDQVTSEDTFAAFNAITGYENTGKAVSHSYIMGSHNTLENGVHNIVVGNYQSLQGDDTVKAEGNIILGFREREDKGALKSVLKHAVVLGNKTKATEDYAVVMGYEANVEAENGIAIGFQAKTEAINGVALGTQSLANTKAEVVGYDPVTDKAKVANEVTSVWQSTLGAVSVGYGGTDGKAVGTRQITNVAAGMADTDAVNVAQLKSLRGMIINPTISILSQGVKDNNAYTAGTSIVENQAIHGMMFDFGEGLYAEKQKNADGKDVILVGVDKSLIKPGEAGPAGKQGETGPKGEPGLNGEPGQ